MKLPPEVRQLFVKAGRKGGKKGGRTTGPSKNRGAAHYARLAQIRADKRAKAQQK